MKYLAWSSVLIPALALGVAHADIILLDEYWSPEIIANDVVATEVDAQETGDPAEAKFGECSAKLENLSGSPNVRFRGAAALTLASVPPGDSELSVWYRTDGWTGTWRGQVWAWHSGLTDAPVLVLEAKLDGGGQNGQLIGDDQWHEARGTLAAAGKHEATPKDAIMSAVYFWLVPDGGWDVRHRTYIDCVSIEVVAGDQKGKPAPPPARRIRPNPGAQTDGPGWVWFEGEDAFEHNVPTGGAALPQTEAQQALLSNGTWLSHHAVPDLQAQWEITVPEDGRYAFWCRGQGAPFRWRWDNGAWQECPADAPWTDLVQFQDHGGYGWMELAWVCLGQADLTRGRHVLGVINTPDDESVGFDCWLLTRGEFTPRGATKPPA